MPIERRTSAPAPSGVSCEGRTAKKRCRSEGNGVETDDREDRFDDVTRHLRDRHVCYGRGGLIGDESEGSEGDRESVEREKVGEEKSDAGEEESLSDRHDDCTIGESTRADDKSKELERGRGKDERGEAHRKGKNASKSVDVLSSTSLNFVWTRRSNDRAQRPSAATLQLRLAQRCTGPRHRPCEVVHLDLARSRRLIEVEPDR